MLKEAQTSRRRPSSSTMGFLTRLRAMLDLGLTWLHMAAPQVHEDSRLCTQYLMQTPVSMRAGHAEAAVLHFDVCHSAGCRGCMFPSKLHACSPVARVTGFRACSPVAKAQIPLAGVSCLLKHELGSCNPTALGTTLQSQIGRTSATGSGNGNPGTSRVSGFTRPTLHVGALSFMVDSCSCCHAIVSTATAWHDHHVPASSDPCCHTQGQAGTYSPNNLLSQPVPYHWIHGGICCEAPLLADRS